MAEFKRYCKDCRAAYACKYTFATFWKYKSSGGVGCDAPLTDRHAADVEDAVFKKAKLKAEQTEMFS